MVPETSVIFNQLIYLGAQEDFISLSRREILRSYRQLLTSDICVLYSVTITVAVTRDLMCCVFMCVRVYTRIGRKKWWPNADPDQGFP
jgi:hypothetical protein